MDWTYRRKALRAIIAGKRCIFPAAVYDGMGARLAEEIGFKAVMLPGSVASYSTLAAPDSCIVTLSEVVEQVLRINRAGRLPLLVDADHGYGNALNVKRTVEDLETAGVAALTIEDTLLPAPFGGDGKPALIPIAEGVGRMRAALAGRQDPRLIIVGRTSAIAISGLEDTIARIQAYEAAGVDMVFLGGVTTRDQIDALTSAVRIPVLMGNIPDALRDADYLAARNVKICLVGSDHTYWASVHGFYEALKSVHAGAGPNALKSIPADLKARILRDDTYKAWRKDFMT